MACRINKRREWAHRIELESYLHGDNCFATLTYSDEHLPPAGSLDPRHTTLWLKNFRKAVAPAKIRYYLVGEYGDETWRPHYHAALFGFPSCLRGRTRPDRKGSCCPPCDLVRSTWEKGLIELGPLNPDTAAYIAGYVTKKMTKHDDPRLGDRHPEFARMSLRPGIGYHAMHELADRHLRYNDAAADVPTSLRHGSRNRPLGRYLSRTLRAMVGRDPGAPQAVLDAKKAELQNVLDAAKDATSAPGMGRYKSTAIKNLALSENSGKRARFSARQKLFKKKRTI